MPRIGSALKPGKPIGCLRRQTTRYKSTGWHDAATTLFDWSIAPMKIVRNYRYPTVSDFTSIFLKHPGVSKKISIILDSFDTVACSPAGHLDV